MPKLTRTKIARGTKLRPASVYDPIGAIATQLTSPSTQIPTPTAGVTKEQYNKENGIFRLNWTIPYIGSEWTRTNGVATPYIIPFNLVHLQEFWNVQGNSDELTPIMKLVELSFGFDQRDEGGFVTDQWCGIGDIAAGATNENYDEIMDGVGLDSIDEWACNLNAGKIYAARDDEHREVVAADIATRGPLTLSLHRKGSDYYDQYIPGDVAGSYEEIYNLPVGIESLIGRAFKANPTAVTGLSINVDPYSTYMLGIRPPRLHDDRTTTGPALGANLAIVNLTVSLKFKHVLVQRDSTRLVDDPINLPSHGSLKTADTITINTPLANTPIEAETADGVQTNLEAIDRPFHDHLQGGLSDLSDVGVVEHVCEDAAYEVIAIPMWNNQWNNQTTIKHLREIGTTPYQMGVAKADGRIDTITNSDLVNPITDRAIIPINFPMTIHHIVVAHNNLTTTIVKGEHNLDMYAYTSSPSPANDTGGFAGISASTVEHKIGIALGRGIRAGEYGYKPVGLYEGPLGTDHGIDTIRMNYNTTSPQPATTFVYDNPNGLHDDARILDYPEWTLNYIPLSTGGAVAPGLYTTGGSKATPLTFTNIQGPPVFAGNSYITPATSGGSTAPAGSAAGTSVRGSTPETEDQWIEVRWSVYPNGTGAGDDWLNNWTAGDAARIINGYGGSWIYIIGKKHTVSDQNWQKPYYKKGL